MMGTAGIFCFGVGNIACLIPYHCHTNFTNIGGKVVKILYGNLPVEVAIGKIIAVYLRGQADVAVKIGYRNNTIGIIIAAQ